MKASARLLAVLCLSAPLFAQVQQPTPATPSPSLHAAIFEEAARVDAPAMKVPANQNQLALALPPKNDFLPDAPAPQSSTNNDTEHKRILWVIPAYDVYPVSTKGSLTSREKFNLFTDSSFDRFTLISAAFDAGINQATNTPEGYGQGGEAFGKRYGVALGDKIASDFFKIYAFPSLFHTDPRYFQLGTGTGGHRIGYAISRAFVTRKDSGGNTINMAEILGTGASAGLVNAYYEDRDRDAMTTLERWGTRIGVDAATNIFKEFWPAISRKMGINRKKDTK
jgi:hypothetical protein